MSMNLLVRGMEYRFSFLASESVADIADFFYTKFTVEKNKFKFKSWVSSWLTPNDLQANTRCVQQVTVWAYYSEVWNIDNVSAASGVSGCNDDLSIKERATKTVVLRALAIMQVRQHEIFVFRISGKHVITTWQKFKINKEF